MSRATLIRFVAWATALPALACDVSLASVEGELRRGQFVYTCVEDTDALCSDFDRPDDFPAVFGRGSRFSVSYSAQDDDVVGITVEPSSPELMTMEDDVFSWHALGEASILALHDGELYDFVNVGAAEIDHLRFSGVSAQDDVVLVAGETQVLRATPQDSHGRRIGGALEYQWTVEDSEVAVIVSEAFLERVEVEAVQKGITALRVDVGGSVHSVPIVVGPP